jgi:Mg-chelatase subunit ChlI
MMSKRSSELTDDLRDGIAKRLWEERIWRARNSLACAYLTNLAQARLAMHVAGGRAQILIVSLPTHFRARLVPRPTDPLTEPASSSAQMNMRNWAK